MTAVETDSLAAWLLEQVAEDERLANACLTDEVCPWRDEDWVEIGSPSIDHVQRHDPHRVLAECEAKRRIIETHRPYDCTDPKGQRCFVCASTRAYPSGAAIHEAWPCPTLRLLALPHADRPGYREEWRP